MKYQNFFLVGDEWLYFKIYCGPKMADDLLIQLFYPLIKKFSKSGIIDKWFFIRYADPDVHLRIRLRILDISDIPPGQTH